MVCVYPLLVSSSVSQESLPAICKALEKFILVYDLDNVIARVNKRVNWGKLIKLGATITLMTTTALMFKSSLEKTKREIRNLERDIDKGLKSLKKMKRLELDKASLIDEPIKMITGSEHEGKMKTVDVMQPNQNVLSLEPTWMKVNTSFGTKLIGVKVVPFPIKDEKKFFDIFTNERLRSQSFNIIDIIVRKLVKVFWTYWSRTLDIITATPRGVTGNPITDVVYSKTIHGENIFTVFSLSDVGSEVLSDVNKIAKMQKAGWCSFIICDDVNKKAYFCMKQFKGLCSIVPYKVLYTALGKEQSKVFEDLDDVKRTVSPFFRLSVDASKVINK